MRPPTDSSGCPDCIPHVAVGTAVGLSRNDVPVIVVVHAEGCPWFAGKIRPNGDTELITETKRGIVIHTRDLTTANVR